MEQSLCSIPEADRTPENRKVTYLEDFPIKNFITHTSASDGSTLFTCR